MSNMTDFEMNNVRELYLFLKNNKNTTDSSDFQELWERLHATISTAQLVDSFLHVKEFKNMMDNVINPYNLRVLWKKPYNNAKNGDIINGGKVVGVFTLTVWIENLEDDYHLHCCEHECCE